MSLSFSVITPSYNQGRFIEKTIQSVLDQSGVEFEYLIVDGGSSDSTLEIIKQYDDQLGWVSEPDLGQADAVNKGIKASHGEIIAWINSDDVYYPSAFEKVQQLFLRHPDVQVIYGNANHIDGDGNFIEPYPTEEWNYRRLRDYCFICQPATFFRRCLIDKYGFLKTELQYSMDYELWLRFGKYTQFLYCSEILAGSRLYKETKTLSQPVEVHAEVNTMQKQKFGRSSDKWILAYAVSSIIAKKGNQDASHVRKPNLKIIDLPGVAVEVVKGYWRWGNFLYLPLTCFYFIRLFASSLVRVRRA
jgi:glycosyltransferase involved in cell wall biosynthesis